MPVNKFSALTGRTMSRTRAIAFAFWLIVTVVPVIGVIVGIALPDLFFGTQEQVKDALSQFGLFGVVIFILIQIVQVVIPPISHYATSIIGGFLYGAFWGGVFNWLGRVTGQFVAYTLARKYGRRVVERFVDKQTVENFDQLVAGNSQTLWLKSLVLFLMIFLPFFPDDELSYLCGLAKFNFKAFVAITLLGHLGGSFALAYAGAGVNTQDSYFWFLLIITFVLFGILMWTLLRLRKFEKKVTV